MSEPKFTPGLNFGLLPKEETENHLANAHLIAAAPEMYEALEKIQEIELSIAQEYRVNADDSQIYNIAEKVLRKARGESEDDE